MEKNPITNKTLITEQVILTDQEMHEAYTLPPVHSRWPIIGRAVRLYEIPPEAGEAQ